jgi:nitrate/nitrite transport system substrate-binding protein
VKIGFIPLTDCASVVMASVLGFDKKYGVKIIPARKPPGPACATSWSTASWMAHVLYGLVYGVHLGIGGPKKDMAVLMTSTTTARPSLSKKLADKGAVDARRWPS